MAIVHEVEPGVFLPWLGTTQLPASIEFTMTAPDLAAMGLYVPLPEDTMPPSHFHDMGDIVTVRDADGLVRRVVQWQPNCDLETAREVLATELTLEAESRADALAIAGVLQHLLQEIAEAPTLDALIALDLTLPVEDRTLENPTPVETL